MSLPEQKGPGAAVPSGAPEAEFEPEPKWFGPRISLGFSAFFLYTGLFLPYFPIWLQSRDLTPLQISTVLSMSLVIRVLASGQVMAFADTRNDRATVLSALYLASAIAILFYLPASTFFPILLVTLFYNFFFNPVLPLLDAITLAGVRRFDADYGKIRIWGSIVFILANLGGGVLLAGYDADLILYALVIAMAAGALFSFAIPRIGRVRPYKEAETESRWLMRRQFLTDRRFVMVLLATGLAQASHAFVYGFGSIYWQSIGYSGTFIGLLWAIGVVAEVILFQNAKGLFKQVSATQMIVFGCVGGLVRWALFPFVDSEFPFLALQILHGASFGATHIGLMQFILESVPEENIGAAQGAGFVLGGVAMGAAVFASGPLYAAFGPGGFWVMAAMCAAALVLLTPQFTTRRMNP
jgi:PPP family 3-phenylpropionic acid transporter